MNWGRAAERDLVRDRGVDPVEPEERSYREGRGITNAQAKTLAKLQRRAGVPYTGSGLSAAEASEVIARLRNK